MIGIVVLAAGRSTRMGSQKLLLPLGDKPVIGHVVAAALRSALRPVVVVVGHQASDIKAAIDSLEVRLVDNPLYAQGLSTSLIAGIAVLPEDLAGAIIMLGDQPLVTADHLDEIAALALASGAPIVAAGYNGRRGNPVYFARSLFPELMTSTGDEGGRVVIARHTDQVMLAPSSDDSASLDVDDPSDYARVVSVWRHQSP
jgi:molybdenum cofactor cytidylyltransferase